MTLPSCSHTTLVTCSGWHIHPSYQLTHPPTPTSSDDSPMSSDAFNRTVGEDGTLCRDCRKPMEYGFCADGTKWYVCPRCDDRPPPRPNSPNHPSHRT